MIELNLRCFWATEENSLIGIFSSSLIAKQNYPNKQYAKRYFSEKIFLEKGVELLLSNKIKTIGEYSLIGFLGRIQDLTKGGSDKRPPKVVAPRGYGVCSPGKCLILGSLKCDFQRFQGQFEVI